MGVSEAGEETLRFCTGTAEEAEGAEWGRRGPKIVLKLSQNGVKVVKLLRSFMLHLQLFPSKNLTFLTLKSCSNIFP